MRNVTTQSFNSYYAFGSLQPGRWGNSDNYPQGFNSMRMDNELKGTGNNYTTPFRLYDPRLGRWMSRDPVTKAYESPYAGHGNNPIWFADPSGLSSDTVFTGGETSEVVVSADGLSEDEKRQAKMNRGREYYFNQKLYERDLERASSEAERQYMYMARFEYGRSRSSRIAGAALIGGTSLVWGPALATELVGIAPAVMPKVIGYSLSARATAASIDLGAQLGYGYYQYGSLSESFGSMNLTSVGMSFMAPSMRTSIITKNAMIGAGMEFSIGGGMNVLGGDKRLGQFATESAIGTAFGFGGAGLKLSSSSSLGLKTGINNSRMMSRPATMQRGMTFSLELGKNAAQDKTGGQ